MNAPSLKKPYRTTIFLITFWLIGLIFPATLSADGPPPLETTASWHSGDTDFSQGMAWGDVDGDGDLDLAVANDNGPNKLYFNEGGLLQTEANTVWLSNDADETTAVAWGDVDNDGDLDLAVSNGDGPNKLYLNENGSLQPDAVWQSADDDFSQGLAWGDMDNDGDLDLAVANQVGSNKIYRNEAGTLNPVAVWLSADSDPSVAVAWADVDDDGYLDLAVGNRDQFGSGGGANKLHLNSAAGLNTVADWQSNDSDDTSSLAWGDVDDDGDLDLAAGNRSGANALYLNEGGSLDVDSSWTPLDDNVAYALAWGDVDSDGDLDLAVSGYNRPNKIYINENGSLATNPDWLSGEANNRTTALAWGDVDGDGDLDLATVNVGQSGGGAVNRLYRNDRPQMETFSDSPWQSANSAASRSAAWGDVDGDGDLDLAIANEVTPNALYRNQNGVLNSVPIWQSAEPTAQSRTWSVAWGDMDNDGDLDLAVGNVWHVDNGGYNFVYENVAGVLQTTPVWSSTDRLNSYSIAWGDVDEDGDLDLAVGNSQSPNQLFLNQNGLLDSEPSWQSDEADRTLSLAWGDVDGDTDLDLAVGNSQGPNKLYLNQAGSLQTAASWQSGDDEQTNMVAWADVDGDGDLDLAVANSEVGGSAINKIYFNDGGQLQTAADPIWTSLETAVSRSVAWADADNDGDLDLAVGNSGSLENALYQTVAGQVQANPPFWTSGHISSTFDLVWGDLNRDGYLDLASAEFNDSNLVYRNKGTTPASLVNHPTQVVVDRPGNTDWAYFYSTPEIIDSPIIPITYRLFDRESDPVWKIIPEFSANGGGQWWPATPVSDSSLTNLTASPTGTLHTFKWQADADLIKSNHVLFRITAIPSTAHSPLLWPAQSGQSPPFRVAAAEYIQVLDDEGDPVAGATVYRNGRAIDQTTTGLTVTNQAGMLNPTRLRSGDALVALALQAEQPTIRDQHDGWAYRTYITNLGVDADGETESYTVVKAGPHRLTVRPENTLIVFNIVVSVEWDATEAYLDEVAQAMDYAADFLYDASDGQMTFGQVAIYDDAQHWVDADIQIAAKNVVHPHAYIGGIWEEEKARLIRVGRFWDGNTANRGNWQERDGYATLVHEFGHYALGLYDEYFGFQVDDFGNLLAQTDAFCSGPENYPGGTPLPATAASIMDFHYNSSELADVGRWTAWCQLTAQHLLNNGEADWQTIARLYGDSQNRWQLRSPDQRGGFGHVVIGPNQLPDALPFPQISVTNQQSPTDPEPFAVRVCLDGQAYQAGAWITLNRADGRAMDQGVTDEVEGQLTILGAEENDTLLVVSLDGAYAASGLVSQILPDGLINLTSATSRRKAEPTPYLRLWPATSSGTLDGIRLAVTQSQPGDEYNYALTGSDMFGPAAAIPYDATEGYHQVQVGFVPTAKTGYANVNGQHNGAFIKLNVDYRLQQANPVSQTNLFSNDGIFSLQLDQGVVSSETHFLIASPWGLPGSLPPGLEIAGEAYEITASGNLTDLNAPAILRLRYDAAISTAFSEDSLAIYRWNFSSQNWQHLGGSINQTRQEVVTTTQTTGLYALLGQPSQARSSQVPIACGDGPSSGDMRVYLPVVVKE